MKIDIDKSHLDHQNVPPSDRVPLSVAEIYRTYKEMRAAGRVDQEVEHYYYPKGFGIDHVVELMYVLSHELNGGEPVATPPVFLPPVAELMEKDYPNPDKSKDIPLGVPVSLDQLRLREARLSLNMQHPEPILFISDRDMLRSHVLAEVMEGVASQHKTIWKGDEKKWVVAGMATYDGSEGFERANLRMVTSKELGTTDLLHETANMVEAKVREEETPGWAANFVLAIGGFGDFIEKYPEDAEVISWMAQVAETAQLHVVATISIVDYLKTMRIENGARLLYPFRKVLGKPADVKQGLQLKEHHRMGGELNPLKMTPHQVLVFETPNSQGVPYWLLPSH